MASALSRRTMLVCGARSVGGLATVAVLAACGAAPTATGAPTAAATSAVATSAAATSAMTTAPSTTSAGSTARSVSATAQPAAAGNGKAVEIRWQNRNGNDAVTAFQAAVQKDFEASHPDIKVSVEGLPSGSRDQKLLAQMAGGDAPDVFETWRGNVEQYAQKDLLVDVTPLLAQSKIDTSDFYPWQWKNFQIDVYGSLGQGNKVIRFGMPKYVNMMVLWVNKDLFQQKGMALPTLDWNQNDYASAMEKLTTRQADQVTTLGAWIVGVDGIGREWARIAAWGGQIVDPNDPTKCMLDQTPALDALEWARHLIWDTKTMTVASSGLPKVGTGDAFWAGKVGMREDGFYPFTNAQNNASTKITWVYAPVPKGPVQRKVEGTSDGFAIWQGTPHVSQAWEVLQYLSGPTFQATQSAVTGELPVRTSVLAKWKSTCLQKYPELEQVNLDVATQAMQLGYPQDVPEFYDDSDASDIIGKGLQALFDKPGTTTDSFRTVAQQVTDTERLKRAGK
jgi:multiple sugar transport system substrate-binding protein